ncbi:MAG: L-seryl-tRNA(Sec) selenium transferase [Myxococcales bacterium]|nr:L-seryl-tRNA(Sec) selenium transferase [Myxococcales bacterium]
MHDQKEHHTVQKSKARKNPENNAISEKVRQSLGELPQVGRLLEQEGLQALLADYPRSWLVDALREELAFWRERLLQGADEEVWPLGSARWVEVVQTRLEKRSRPRFLRVINATGVVLHTNLGRAPLARSVAERVLSLGSSYSNLEFDLVQRTRGSRQSLVEDLLCEVTGAEAALVVNNNAAAVMLMLQTVASGREVILSRGEMVEIGGSFRMPDVMASAGSTLREVGTTNRTHLRDYEQAINDQTGLLLKVHRSNFVVEGFVKEVAIQDLMALGAKRGLPVMIDQGSGMLVELPDGWGDKSWSLRGLHQQGADLVTWSGDKLFGGPQCGVITGKAAWIRKASKMPIARALRVDKLTLAALEATLQIYARGDEAAWSEIPILSALREESSTLCMRAEAWVQRWREPLERRGWSLTWEEAQARVGGGSLPGLSLPTARLCLRGGPISLNAFEMSLRERSVPIVGLLERGGFFLDLRTLLSGDEQELTLLFQELSGKQESQEAR